ncbi:Uncharacterised protein [Chlamydia trachomatis]|nr:Uncharacterised protein [Chlamydia trachomatis]
MFVADFYPLTTVNFLNFRKKISFHRQDVTDFKQAFWLDRTFCKCCTAGNLVTHLNLHTSCKWYHIFAFTSLTFNVNFLSTSCGIFINSCNFTLNFCDNRFPFRVTSFKDFLDTRKTLCDIAVRGNTTRVEGTHCKLCTRFTDRLGSDCTNCFTNLNRITSRQVNTITVTADTVACVTCKYATDSNLFNTSIDDLTSNIFCNQFVWTDNKLTSFWMFNRFLSVTTLKTFFKWLNHFFTICDRADIKTTVCSTVIFTNDNVLGNVNQTTSQVT